jgi:hypothetical protein
MCIGGVIRARSGGGLLPDAFGAGSQSRGVNVTCQRNTLAARETSTTVGQITSGGGFAGVTTLRRRLRLPRAPPVSDHSWAAVAQHGAEVRLGSGFANRPAGPHGVGCRLRA